MKSTIKNYIKNLQKTSFLTWEEERNLLKEIKNGNAHAKESLILSHLPLVVKIASKFAYYGTPVQDLISEGCIGLMRAIEKFDNKFERRFSKYASCWIKWTIMRALINSSKTIYIPVYMAEILSKWRKTSSMLTSRLNRLPGRDEIAEELQVDDKHAQWIECASRSTYTINETCLNEEDSDEFSKYVVDERTKMPEEEAIELNDKNELRRLLDTIGRRESNILKMRYGIDYSKPMTLREVSKELNISREWVRKIEKKALLKLNHLMARSA